ncbi:MAG: AAA+ family ATPase, partial [Sphaerospermopsis kisseleviana]
QLVLNAYLWQNVNHIEVKTLWKYLTNYLYLPRLKNAQVLLNTVQEGVAALLLTENFAYADGYDEAKQRYLGLKSSEHITVSLSQQSLVVKPDIALKQIQADTAIKESQISTIEKSENANFHSSNSSLKVEDRNSNSGYNITQKEQKQPQKQLRRFYGVVDLDPVRVSRDVGVISQEILQHLTGLVDAKVQITLEIQVQLSEPVPDHILRTVNENCRTLKFKTHSFEEE